MKKIVSKQSSAANKFLSCIIWFRYILREGNRKLNKNCLVSFVHERTIELAKRIQVFASQTKLLLTSAFNSSNQPFDFWF